MTEYWKYKDYIGCDYPCHIITNKKLEGVETICPYCKNIIVLGREHPIVEPPKPKPSFRYYKPIEKGEVVQDEYGWVREDIIERPAKLDIDWDADEQTIAVPDETDLNKAEQKVQLKSDVIKYNALVYDIQIDGELVTGKYWTRHSIVTVKLVHTNLWTEVSRTKQPKTSRWDYDWYILSVCGIPRLQKINANSELEYAILDGPYEDEQDAEYDLWLHSHE